tara:strand:+ start:241 stop:546 length:306 start_codon:yes stop_codon:yes gene_type:complete
MTFYKLASEPTSIAMIGAVLSFVGVGFLILIFSERMFHGLSKLIYIFGNQILISRRLFSKKYIEENKASKNHVYRKQAESTHKVSLSEQKEWLEKILKMKV